MILLEGARTGLDEIGRHKLRSSLTLLGIALGTLSITVMVAFMEGVVGAVWQAFSEYRREDLVFVVERGPRTPRERVLFARSRGLQPADARILEDHARGAAVVAPYVFDWASVRAERTESEASLLGVTPGFAAVYGRSMESGRFLGDLEEGSFARVCVLSFALKQKLFGSEDALGRIVIVNSRPYRVVGVEERRGNDLVDDLFHREDRDLLYVPLSTLRKFRGGERDQDLEIVVRVRDPERLGELIQEIEGVMRRAHRGAGDFEVYAGDRYVLRFRKSIEDLIRTWIVVLGSVAGVSLLVGGIGLLSMMLIAINERLYEIGLRKALGATERDLFLQFLCESVILAFAGGCLGVLAGAGFTRAVAGYFKAGLPLNPLALAAAVGVAVLIGALYGIYPALKAARLPPVEALRSAG
jgi:putative ABC transport system permease protein